MNRRPHGAATAVFISNSRVRLDRKGIVSAHFLDPEQLPTAFRNSPGAVVLPLPARHIVVTPQHAPKRRAQIRQKLEKR